MSVTTDKIETDFLACCYLDGGTIDRAIAAGVGADAFGNAHHAEQWRLLCALRLTGKPTDTASLYSEAVSRGLLEKMGGMDAILSASDGVPTTAHAAQYVEALLVTHAKRQSWVALTRAIETIKDGTANLDGLRSAGEAVAAICTSQHRVQRSISDVAADAIKAAQERIEGKTATRTLIYTGLPMFDRYATPIESHEIVVVGARTSYGKTSLLTQIAGHNIARKMNVAFFPLETSDTPTLEQIVGQRVGVNPSRIAEELQPKQKEYIDKLRFAGSGKNLLIFDRDMTLAAIEARCRLLVASFKPDLVIIDYLGLIKTDDKESYQRLTTVSKAMIPLCKMLGCALLIGAQFSREVEKDRREPTRTDFRDSGSIEEDASRIIAIHRDPGQSIDGEWFSGALLQLKNRNGPTARVPIRFHGPTRRFVEEATHA